MSYNGVTPEVRAGVEALKEAGLVEAATATNVEAYALDVIDGATLYDQEYPNREFLVEGLIARGNLVMLAGRPKAGKSWLTLQLAQALDTGGEWLGRKASRCRVLLIALEDGERRIHERMHIRRWRPQTAGFAFHMHPLAGGGKFELQNAAFSGLWDCIIIDSLRAANQGIVDENDNSDMSALLQSVADIAHQSEVAIIIVHHTRKSWADDSFDAISGAGAIRGAYDVGLVLDRKRGEREAVLAFESRDLELEDVTIYFDPAHGWQYLGSASRRDEIRAGRRVVQALRELSLSDPERGGWFTTAEIAQALEVGQEAARKQLLNALRDGLIRRRSENAEQRKGGKARDLWALAQG